MSDTKKEKLKVIKLVPEATLPAHSKSDDAGYDCVAIDDGKWSADKTYIEYRTGIAIEVPPGYHTEVFPRSSVSKYDLVLANSVGLIDWGYRSEILFRFKYIPRNISLQLTPMLLYKKGDRIGQIVIRKTFDFVVEEVESLSKTERGFGGFGSTGN